MKNFILFIVVIFIFIFLSVSQSFSQKKILREEMMGEKANVSPLLQEAEEVSLKAEARKKEINKIRLDYTEKKISFEEAKRRLKPLVEEELKDYLANLDYQIQVLEKKLQFLKKVKQNPSYLIETRIKEILGEVSPQEINPW